MRVCRSVTMRLMDSVVFFNSKKSPIRIATCTTRAIAATMLKNSIQNCIGTPLSAYAAGTTKTVPYLELRLGFAQIRVATSLNRSIQGIALARSGVLATLDEIVGAL